MSSYPTFVPAHQPPPSHLHLPMGSTPAIAPDDHFAPPLPPGSQTLSRSNSPPVPNSVHSLVNTPASSHIDPVHVCDPTMVSSPAPSVQSASTSHITAAKKTSDAGVDGQPPSWSPNTPGHPPRDPHNALPGPSTQPMRTSTKRKLDASETDDPHAKIRRVVRDHVSHNPARLKPMTTVLCLHAAVAQKSYGTEKRFLCPPPIVHIEGPVWNLKSQQLSMTVVSEGGERSLEQRAPVDQSMSASFKFLHVTGSAKSKSFQLSLVIAEPPPLPTDGTEAPIGRVWATFESAPVTIISKPSKKTAKTRNIASCILAGGPVSLFNRINSQTVRTKYMTVDNGQLCASNTSWSAFNVNVVRQQGEAPPIGPQPVTYGSEIVLSDTLTGIQTASLIIRKVDKGRIAPDDGGPVSQMQKIALQRVQPDGTRHYLSAAGPLPNSQAMAVPPAPGLSNQSGTHPLMFQAPRVREEVKEGVRVITDEVDDYLCWTIVGISKFQYTFFDAFGQNNTVPEMPITPFPTLFQAPAYRPANNTLELTVANFFYDDPKTRAPTPLDIYVGNIGPLRHRFYQATSPGPLTSVSPFVQAIGPDGVARDELVGAPVGSTLGGHLPPGPVHTVVMVDMPSMADMLRALEEDLELSASAEKDGPSEGSSRNGDGPSPETVEPAGPQLDNATAIAGRSLPLLFIRSTDGVGYHSGRAIACENVFQSMDLAGMAGPGTAGAGSIGSIGSIDSGWLAAAQAAAAVDGGLHGWTLRVI